MILFNAAFLKGYLANPLEPRQKNSPNVKYKTTACIQRIRDPELSHDGRNLKGKKVTAGKKKKKMARSNTVSREDHYTILNLPFPSSNLSKQQLKLAYHRALLRHHPDKTQTSDQDQNPSTRPTLNHNDGPIYTIDEITTAYKTLADPALRAEYDRALRLDRLKIVEREKTGAVFHTGLEVVDLEDLGFEEGNETEAPGGDDDFDNDTTETGSFWYRGCRCGDEKGFVLTEEDLEREAEHGEIVVGCRGCSLWMKVLFAVDNGEAEDG